jgi:hypothetical protein
MTAPNVILYLDESGDHQLRKPDLVDDTYPVFVLAGCVIAADHHDCVLAPRLSRLKIDHCGRDDIVIHTADITRNRGPFERLIDPAVRHPFYQALCDFVAAAEFTLIACAIRKPEHLHRYGASAHDPYELSLECLVERFVYELNARGLTGSIVAESRGSDLDRKLALAYNHLLLRGTRFVRPQALRAAVPGGLVMRQKSDNVAGLQLADLCATPIGRWVLGKPERPDWLAIAPKFRRGRGTIRNWGLIILPEWRRG